MSDDPQRVQHVFRKIGLAVERHRLVELKPRWMASEEPMRYGMGFSMQCPRHEYDANDRLEFWFVRPKDGGDALTRGGGVRPDKLFDFTGKDFEGLTVWTSQPQREASVAFGTHWWGYIAEGIVYSCARWAAV